MDPNNDNYNIIFELTQFSNTGLIKLLWTNTKLNPSYQNNYAILTATKHGHVDIVKILLQDNRVNPADSRDPAIIWAVRFGFVTMIDSMLLHLDTNQYLPLLMEKAALRGDADMVGILLEKFKLNYISPIFLIKKVVKDYNESLRLHNMALVWRIRFPNEYSYYADIEENNYASSIELLIDNQLDKYILENHHILCSVFMYVVGKKYIVIARAILKYIKFDPSIMYIFVTYCGHLEIMKNVIKNTPNVVTHRVAGVLSEKKISIDDNDYIKIAIRYGHVLVVEFLLEKSTKRHTD
jgi:hypothetical protein